MDNFGQRQINVKKIVTMKHLYVLKQMWSFNRKPLTDNRENTLEGCYKFHQIHKIYSDNHHSREWTSFCSSLHTFELKTTEKKAYPIISVPMPVWFKQHDCLTDNNPELFDFTQNFVISLFFTLSWHVFNVQMFGICK